MTARIRLLGRPRIEFTRKPADPAAAPAAPRGQKAWAVLARVALSDRPPTRGELAAELFADAADPLAALRWCLADLRRAHGDPTVLRGDPVRPDRVAADAAALLAG